MFLGLYVFCCRRGKYGNSDENVCTSKMQFAKHPSQSECILKMCSGISGMITDLDGIQMGEIRCVQKLLMKTKINQCIS